MANATDTTLGASLRAIVDQTTEVLDALEHNFHEAGSLIREVGRITSIEEGTARVEGLPNVRAEELIRFPLASSVRDDKSPTSSGAGIFGLAFNLEPDQVGVVLLGSSRGLKAGGLAFRTGRILEVPVGDELLGRVVDPLGRPMDDGGPLRPRLRLPVERSAPPIMHRAAVSDPLQTGIKVIDALLPVGRGQRELILGDRQTGKTAIALDTILNQHVDAGEPNVVCIYCAIGQRTSAVSKLIGVLKSNDALRYSIVMIAGGDDAPGLQFIAPFAATTMAEYFMAQGRHVLIVYDDLTRHARAYRELSLLLRRPPGREAYPGDIFYLHSRLLERSTHLRPEFGGGSLTALPIVETQAQNISAYIPTNLISITDGQIYLSPDLFHKGILPAVDVGRSVSRVGGKAQLPCFRAVAGDLRLSYAQFEELEVFARFGTRLDEHTRQTLERGRRVREIFKQPQYQPLAVAEQIAILLATSEGLFDGLKLDEIAAAEAVIRESVRQHGDIARRLEAGAKFTDEDRQVLVRAGRASLDS